MTPSSSPHPNTGWTTPLTPGTPRLLFGGDYNPEQWPPSVWPEDARLMRAAGVNLVTLGVFAWSRIQPTPDAWDVGWLDEVIELLSREGIGVDLATPTAGPPPWFSVRHPDGLAVREDGVRYSHGSRNHYCPSSRSYRDACLDVAGRLADRYAHHPGVVMWHVGNEYGTACYCDSCAAAFRDWLRDRYGTLDALNDAWGTAFWSQRYGAWEEVRPPRTAPYLINPAQTLDYRRYTSDQLLAAYLEQAEAIRLRRPDAVVTTNFMGFYRGADYRRWAAHVDVVADDHYIDPSSPAGPHVAGLTHELVRGLAGGRPWLLMEQAMGAVNWREHNVPKTAAQRRNDVLRALARGADGVLSFQWRQAASGSERYHSAMLPNAGPDTKLHADVRALGALLQRLAPHIAATTAEAPVTLLFDWDSWWTAEEASVPSRRRAVVPVLTRWFAALTRARVGIRVAGPHDDLSDAKVVVAPVLHSADTGTRRTLRTLVSSGVPVVLGPFTVAVDDCDRLIPGPFPGGLTDLLGARGEQWWPLPDDGVGVVSDHVGDGHAAGWAEQLIPCGGEVLARFDHPELDAAIVRGAAVPLTYVAFDPDDDQLDRLLAGVLEEAGVGPHLGLLADPPPAEVELVVRGSASFVINDGPDPVDVTLGAPALDLISGTVSSARVRLDAGGALVLVPAEG